MIEKIRLLNLLGFIRDVKDEDISENSDIFEVNFCKGSNIFIGENGTGKTSLLKILYAWCKKIHLFKIFNSFFIYSHNAEKALIQADKYIGKNNILSDGL